MKIRFFPFLLWVASVGSLLAQNRSMTLDMVHHNPGEAFTQTRFSNPKVLKEYGFSAQVINDFQFIHCAITYDSFDSNIFPLGSEERMWVERLALHVDSLIDRCHRNGMKAYYFTDIIVFPKRLKELYAAEICDDSGRIDFLRPKTQELHRVMIREIFNRFPLLDGLVIRVGETYTHNIPYHVGNGPIKRDETLWMHGAEAQTDGGEAVHVALINLLREEVCEKYNKFLLYRTWDFGFFHTQSSYYLNVTNQIEPHSNLFFGIKHVQGDYHRTLKFNPTLGIGRHRQMVEVQCQREYEGKGAYPNYIANGVINGFEELSKDVSPKCLNDLKDNPLLGGLWTWTRGGGWRGPYISNELWCDLNAYVLANWNNDRSLSEEYYFFQWAKIKGFDALNAQLLRKLALLSSDAIVRGRGSLIMPINIWWTRDEFIAGNDQLDHTFAQMIQANKVDDMIKEKEESVRLWSEMVRLSDQIQCANLADKQYIQTSTRYGFYLYAIYEQVWKICLLGYMGEVSGNYDRKGLKMAIAQYDKWWGKFNALKRKHPDAATLYRPYSFVNKAPLFYEQQGCQASIEKWRKIAFSR